MKWSPLRSHLMGIYLAYVHRIYRRTWDPWMGTYTFWHLTWWCADVQGWHRRRWCCWGSAATCCVVLDDGSKTIVIACCLCENHGRMNIHARKTSLRADRARTCSNILWYVAWWLCTTYFLSFCVCVWWVGINNISELSHSFSIVPHAEALHDAWQDWNPQRRISEKKKPKRSAVPEPIVPPKKWHDQKWKGRGWNHQEMHKESGHRVSNLLFGQTWHVCSLHECSSLIAPWQKFYIRCQTSLSGAACVVQHASQQQRWCGLESHGPHAAAAAWCARAERCCALVGQQKGAVQSWHICYI